MPKILPPTLFIALIPPLFLLNFVQWSTLRTLHNSGPPIWEIGSALAIGLLFLLVARIQFSKANAEINTFKKPKNLIVTGLYRVSRNPMYLGFLVILIGLALYINIWQALLAPLVFFLCAHYWYIPIEEEAAEEEFGDAYGNYKLKVRRWL